MSNNRKYSNFQLNWNFNDKKALTKAKRAVRVWIRNNTAGTTNDMRVKDIICKVNPKMYENLSRGDKCRVGRAISTLYNKGYYPELDRGEKKGATNTYHLQ